MITNIPIPLIRDRLQERMNYPDSDRAFAILYAAWKAQGIRHHFAHRDSFERWHKQGSLPLWAADDFCNYCIHGWHIRLTGNNQST